MQKKVCSSLFPPTQVDLSQTSQIQWYIDSLGPPTHRSQEVVLFIYSWRVGGPWVGSFGLSIHLHVEVKEEINMLSVVPSNGSMNQITAWPLSPRRPQSWGPGSHVICIILNTINTQLLSLLLAEGMIARKNKWIPVLLNPYANDKQTKTHTILFASWRVNGLIFFRIHV